MEHIVVGVHQDLFYLFVAFVAPHMRKPGYILRAANEDRASKFMRHLIMDKEYVLLALLSCIYGCDGQQEENAVLLQQGDKH